MAPTTPAQADGLAALSQQMWMIEATRHSQRAMTYAIIGLFFCGLLFGILALKEAAAARRFGVPNGGAEILGWVDIIGFFVALALWLLFTFVPCLFAGLVAVAR